MAGAGMTPGALPSRRRLIGQRVFVAIALADLLACAALLYASQQQGIWLLNLPATITAGRLAKALGGEPLALAVTMTVGALFYGWAGARLLRPYPRGREPHHHETSLEPSREPVAGHSRAHAGRIRR